MKMEPYSFFLFKNKTVSREIEFISILQIDEDCRNESTHSFPLTDAHFRYLIAQRTNPLSKGLPSKGDVVAKKDRIVIHCLLRMKKTQRRCI